MRITFLGTSAGTPTRRRNVTAHVVQFDDGRLWLLDCGEGTQHRLMDAPVRASRIECILITHLHGDHCYGLPGLLTLLAIQGRTDPVRLVGPSGISEMVHTVLRLSDNHLPYDFEVVEVGEAGPQVRIGHWSVSAWPMIHRVRSWGYVLTEDQRPGRFHPERAEALDVPPGPAFGFLKQGRPVVLADGRTIQPAQVCDPDRRGRKIVLLGDTSDASGITAAARECDLLVHEATYDQARADKAIEWGHSTSAMAGDIAAAVAARMLILTHFSSRYDDAGPGLTIADLVREAQARCPDTTVFAAEDYATFAIPDDG